MIDSISISKNWIVHVRFKYVVRINLLLVDLVVIQCSNNEKSGDVIFIFKFYGNA